MDGINGLGCDMYMAGYAIYFGSISYYCFLFVFLVSYFFLSFLSLSLELMTALYISFVCLGSSFILPCRIYISF
ncbi:hypothetical protein LI328DRAFT_39814 [Trichoderma asperelloides]|nr:hypothetical protein LI328DRAFT_39814 [Trichoderma asperelloides]